VGAAARVSSIAIALDALGDTGALWRDWLVDARRRYRIDGADLDRELPNWRPLLERFAEERAPVYLRPDADVSAALRRLHSSGARMGVFSDAPEELARVALAQLGAARRVVLLETGPGALARLRTKLGDDVEVVESRSQLVALGEALAS
jgi:phosphoglycolate phosphatase-like HAD superfamily hydrolase